MKREKVSDVIRANIAPDRSGNMWILAEFNYHPMLVANIKKVRGAVYVKEKKSWAIPAQNKEEFQRVMGDFLVIWDGEDTPFNGGIDAEQFSIQPNMPGYSVDYDDDGNVVGARGFKRPPWASFQVQGFNVMLERSFLILGDEAGLGK